MGKNDTDIDTDTDTKYRYIDINDTDTDTLTKRYWYRYIDKNDTGIDTRTDNTTRNENVTNLFWCSVTSAMSLSVSTQLPKKEKKKQETDEERGNIFIRS